MGRFVDKESPITASTAVLMPATSWSSGANALASDAFSGFEGTTSGTLSATNSITLIALTGPGVISHLQAAPVASVGATKFAIWIDDELVYEQTISSNFACATLIGALFGNGTGLRNYLLDPIPFKSKVLVRLETASTVGWKTSAHYRLTD